MKKRFLSVAICILGITIDIYGTDPTATHYTAQQCSGSAMPYPFPPQDTGIVPDSLTPVFLNHVGRHGARFLSSSKYTASLIRALEKAEEARTITTEGKGLKKLCEEIVTRTAGRWGALDSLGMAEQRAIASTTYKNFPNLFDNTRIHAISSYVPRCVASMDEFTHQLTRLNNKIEIYTSSGRQNSPLMRPWNDDREYENFMSSDQWRKVYEGYMDTQVPLSVARRAMGEKYTFDNDEEARDIAANIYKVVADCAAMGIHADWSRYMTLEEYNALWSVQNLHHYLTHSATTLSSAPMDLASRLLLDLIETLESAAEGNNSYHVMLRFGHAETLMPLLALMRLRGCYYVTNYFDTVGLHWKDFYVVPMAANLQIILLKSGSGKQYVRVDLNGLPIPLIPGKSTIYTPWQNAKEYLIRCLPLYMQP